jgi:predicted nucleic acid-binding protein
VTGLVLVDTCVLINFTVVDRLHVVRCLDLRLRWTEAVAHEVTLSAVSFPGLKEVVNGWWMGEPLAFDDEGDVAQINRLRVNVLGGRRSRPREHLGEAESLHALLSSAEAGAGVLLTDDRGARDYARRRGVTVWQSHHLLSRAHRAGVVGCPEAYEMLSEMRDAGRGVYVPREHTAVCP